MTDQDLTDRNKALVRTFYEGGTNREARSYGEIFHPEFKVTAPGFFPWGGTSDLQAYLDDVLHQVTAVLDFSRCNIVSLVGENDEVVIVIDIALVGADDIIRISEHWTIRNNKAINLWVAYFEPAALMELLKNNKVVS